MIFVTSDTHFFDANLMTHPHFAPDRIDFIRVEDMNETIIEAWNEVVEEKDTVYHLGDIGVFYEHGSNQEMLDILNRLHGNLVLIKGNHDSRDFFKFLDQNNYEVRKGINKFAFEDVGSYFKANHHQFYLTHYPMLLGINKNIINLHGHIHHYSVDIKDNINVGIDSSDFDYFFKDQKPKFGAPISLEQVDFLIRAKADDFAKRR
ncbi:MAG: metallophosphoesterase family protein [Lactobacillaceae bacterium]|jgi:calcineurin-like phosphoesterase family protein|nr:metallophosphoesterase family protein [Lactobacillaceae bacterium]